MFSIHNFQTSDPSTAVNCHRWEEGATALNNVLGSPFGSFLAQHRDSIILQKRPWNISSRVFDVRSSSSVCFNLDINGKGRDINYNKDIRYIKRIYVGPPYCRAEMYASRVACFSLVSGQSRQVCRRDRQTDGRTPDRYITLSVCSFFSSSSTSSSFDTDSSW